MSTKSQDTLIFPKKPEEFTPAGEVAACYIEFEKRLLFLKRATNKPEGGKWGVPGGKIEQNESCLEAVIRETYEETQIVLNKKQLKCVGKLFVRKPEIDYVYHMYYLRLNCLPNVLLNSEHQEYQWLSMEEVVNFPLMSGGLEILYHLFSS